MWGGGGRDWMSWECKGREEEEESFGRGRHHRMTLTNRHSVWRFSFWSLFSCIPCWILVFWIGQDGRSAWELGAVGHVAST